MANIASAKIGMAARLDWCLVLQANYVEALLDQRFFEPAHPIFNYLLGFVIFLIFDYILLIYEHNVVQAVGGVLVLGIVSVGLLYLLIMHLGWYLNPAAVSLLAIVIKLSHLFTGKVQGRVEVGA